LKHLVKVSERSLKGTLTVGTFGCKVLERFLEGILIKGDTYI
jgi:hypothetical protein